MTWHDITPSSHLCVILTHVIDISLFAIHFENIQYYDVEFYVV